MRGKCYLVTGAASGIGRETARRLREQGAQVALLDLNEVALTATAEALKLPSYTVDVTHPEAVAQTIQTVARRFGRLDGVIHSAGVAHIGPFAELDLAHYRRMIDVNLFGTVNVVYAALPYLRESKGSLVLIGSVAAFYGVPDFGVYGAAKAGILNLAQMLRLELSGSGVHVGVICPHFVDTPMYQDESRKSSLTASTSPFVELTSVGQVAEAIINGLSKRRFMIWTGWRPRLIYWITRYASFLNHRIMLATWQNSR